ncbi:hypothetical protein BDQ17DRAFT_1435680 [Cyathus striatus]|nr:hypothetical protein BDQ17DRAFT_1435680 [Cyathus striatus]
MVELPTEIWHHIASYLTDSELLGLLTVNRPFFYLSIAVRYRTLKLSVRDYSTSDKLEKLSHYGLYKFVKVVKLTVRSRGDWKSFGGEWRVSNFDAMLNAIQNVHSLEELHVIAEVQGDDYHAPDEYFCNFIRSLWSSIAVSSISSLHLICSTSSLERLIPLYHTFPSLSKIYLDIVTKANYLNDLNETLAAIIQKLQASARRKIFISGPKVISVIGRIPVRLYGPLLSYSGATYQQFTIISVDACKKIDLLDALAEFRECIASG